MHLVTNTKEPWDFWYELSDWVLKYLNMGSMRGDVIAPKTTDIKGPHHWAAQLGKSTFGTPGRLKKIFNPKPTVITSLRFQDSPSPTRTHFDTPGQTRKRGWTQTPGQLAVYLGPEAEGSKARAFTAILWLAKGLSAFGAPQVDEENLGFYRQPIGAAFMKDWKILLKEWRK